jgi:TetR/AcrR family transcriptional repressor of nem operon
MPATHPRQQVDTRQRILDVAERLVQSRGFKGFSYADVAAELGITKASLHYHFPGKAELGEALIVRYGARFMDALEELDGRVSDPRAKLEGYAGLYAGVLRGKRMCLCGILAAEYETLPPPMRAAVVRFFDENEVWLARVLAQGRSDATLSFDGSPSEAAQAIISGLEGAMLVARPYDDLARFQSAAARLLSGLST